MHTLAPIDRLEILVLVDNVTDNLSTNPAGVTTEFSGLFASGRLKLLCGKAICCAHHGLSFLVTAYIGTKRRCILFDAGPEAEGFLRNVSVLGADLPSVEAVVLSHGHWDHAGGLLVALEAITGGQRGKVDCFMHPGMFATRGIRRADGTLSEMEPVPQPEALAAAGADVHITREPVRLGDGAFYLSGMPGQIRMAADGSGWEPDELLVDERFVAIHVQGKGLVVLTACSHAGVVNVLRHAAATFPDVPLYAVMGGLHLSGSTERIIPQTVADLHEFKLQLIAAGHCTGWRAINALAAAFGDALVPSAVGKRYVIGKQ